jgi:hypothetical protein
MDLCKWCTDSCVVHGDGCDEMQQWMEYWDGLSDEDKRDEMRSMDAYTNSIRGER